MLPVSDDCTAETSGYVGAETVWRRDSGDSAISSTTHEKKHNQHGVLALTLFCSGGSLVFYERKMPQGAKESS